MTSNDKLVLRLENLNDPRLAGLIKDVRNFQYHDLYSPLENPRAVLAHKLLVSGYPSIATEVAAGKFAPSMDEISVWLHTPEIKMVLGDRFWIKFGKLFETVKELQEVRVDETLESKLAECPFCGAAMFEIKQGIWACQFCTEVA